MTVNAFAYSFLAEFLLTLASTVGLYLQVRAIRRRFKRKSVYSEGQTCHTIVFALFSLSFWMEFAWLVLIGPSLGAELRGIFFVFYDIVVLFEGLPFLLLLLLHRKNFDEHSADGGNLIPDEDDAASESDLPETVLRIPLDAGDNSDSSQLKSPSSGSPMVLMDKGFSFNRERLQMSQSTVEAKNKTAHFSSSEVLETHSDDGGINFSRNESNMDILFNSTHD